MSRHAYLDLGRVTYLKTNLDSMKAKERSITHRLAPPIRGAGCRRLLCMQTRGRLGKEERGIGDGFECGAKDPHANHVGVRPLPYHW